MLECVINISEGEDLAILEKLKRSCIESLLDIHVDSFHNRSVFTLAGPSVIQSAQQLATTAIELLDVTQHAGVHPRIGVVDVVPFVPLPDTGSTLDDAIAAQQQFGIWISETHQIPCFFYGNNRSLPEARKAARLHENPDIGSRKSHPTAGMCAVGARNILIAYNLWLAEPDIKLAKKIASQIREPRLRALGLVVGDHVQVSCNLTEPNAIGPAEAYELIEKYSEIKKAELVGLIPKKLLCSIPENKWEQLDLSSDKTIESRIHKSSGLS